MGANWGAQVDGAYGNVDADGSDVDAWKLAGHLYWRNDNFRLGVVALTTQLTDDTADADETSYGVEGSYNFGANTEFNASATTGNVNFLGTDIDAWNVDVGLNYYFSDNIRVGSKVGMGNLSLSGFDDDTQSILLDGEFQPWSAPGSIALSYDHFSSGDAPFDFDADTFRVGARWNFGGGTLRDRNNDTPFDTRSPLYQRLYGLR